MNLPAPAPLEGEDAAPQRRLVDLPPRRLDWHTQAVLLFGDFASQVGWAMFAIGSIFFWTTAAQSEAKIWLEERTATWRETTGKIETADSTGVLEKKQRVWKYGHSFVLDGWRYRGESWSAGKKFDAGQLVFLTYDAENPSTSFVTGNRRSLYNWRVNLVLVIPALGLVLLLAPLRQNLRFIRLLKIGEFTRGRLAGKTATGQSVREGGGERPVFRFQFQFEHGGVAYLASCRTHQASLVEDEAAEIILYDRYRPTFSLVYDAVPNAPVIGALGRMEPVPGWKARLLFLPAFSVAVNAVFALLA